MSFLWSNLGQVWNLTVSHVWLSAIPIVVGFTAWWRATRTATPEAATLEGAHA